MCGGVRHEGDVEGDKGDWFGYVWGGGRQGVGLWVGWGWDGGGFFLGGRMGESFLGKVGWRLGFLMLWDGFFPKGSITRGKKRIELMRWKLLRLFTRLRPRQYLFKDLTVKLALATAHRLETSSPFHIPLHHPSIRLSLTI